MTFMQWSTSSTTPVASVVQVAGAGSALQVTFSGNGATVQGDANGDGTFASPSTLTAAQLKALL